MKTIFIPELDAAEVAPIIRANGYKLPDNVDRPILARWYRGKYYGYGDSRSWIPLNSMGGIATKAFHDHKVRFPAKIDKALREMLRKKRAARRGTE